MLIKSLFCDNQILPVLFPIFFLFSLIIFPDYILSSNLENLISPQNYGNPIIENITIHKIFLIFSSTIDKSAYIFII